MEKKNEDNVIASNPKARHDFFIDSTLECGIELIGTEVKSIRARKVNLKDSYAQIKNNELFVYGMHVSPYEQGNIFNKDPMRARKLLIHKQEIQRLIGLVKQKGVTLVPLSLYWNKNHIKLELAIARGKKLYDKRQDIAKKDAERRMRMGTE
ncbi:MAG: SsrA-binding protein SmpB [Clostridia bacterium]|nr:SsrA-binding protein SmpB [Clostridia bacterium]